jgi:hypothetical protein
MIDKPFLLDPTVKRGGVLAKLAWAASTLSALITVVFLVPLMVVHRPAAGLDTAAEHVSIRAETFDRRPVPTAAESPYDWPLSIGFYVNWDDNSYAALKRALPHLDCIIPAWLSLTGQAMDLKSSVEDRALSYIRATKSNVQILPMIQNAVEGQWDGKGLAKLLHDPAARAARIEDMIAFLERNKFQGLTIDFEEVPPTAHKDLQLFLTEMAARFAGHGYVIVLAVPFDDDSWPYATYAKIADYLLLMGYDQHWEEGTAGSIAGQSWFEETLDKRMKELNPDRTIIAIGDYGYDWVKGQPAEDLTFEEAVLSARDSGANITFDPRTKNPHFSFIEDDGKHHDVWFLDGVTAFNEIHAADTYRPAGYALWRLGAEDPSIWSVLGRPYRASAPDSLRVIGTSEDIDFEGEGGILRIAEKPTPGARTFEVDSNTGKIVDQTYTKAPTPYVVERTGDKSGELALTFDDGPDPGWTPQILADDIVERVIAQASDPNQDIGGHVILLDDSGGDRSQALAALPKLIDTPRAKGYAFVPVAELAEQSRAQAMPPIPLSRSLGLPVLMPLSWLGYLLATLFFVALWLRGAETPIFLRHFASQAASRSKPDGVFAA